MNKENIISLIFIAGLSIAFVLISAFVWAAPDNRYFVKNKIKLGAAILTLTTFISTNSFSQKTCYKPANPSEYININKINDEGNIELKSRDKYITGTINNLRSNDYFYTIVDSELDIISQGKLEPSDGTFDESKETFRINVEKVTLGSYTLNIFNSEESKNKGIADYKYGFVISATRKDQPDVLCYYY